MNQPLRSSTGNAITMMTLNLRFGLADDGPNQWVYRQEAYPALFDGFPCDFYAFQEANDFQIEFLEDLLEGYGYIGQRRPSPEWWQNNVIFFHPVWRCVAHEHFYLSATPDVPSKFSRSRWPRQCTIGLFRREHQSLICATTHLDFDAKVQERSAQLILQRLMPYKKEGPALLTGDFNTTPGSRCYAVLTRDADPSARFLNAFDPKTQGGTHHGFQGHHTGTPIDWILYRGNLSVRAAQVIRDQFNGYYPSDHFPLTATFDMSTEGSAGAIKTL